jgi:RNA 3'-terminal phosphate cyclase (ATP)
MVRIRAKREKPGLRQQHLTCVEAAAEIGRARVQGTEIGSQELWFEPAGTEAGEYHWDIGTAGSAMLVLQTVLPPLLTAAGSSTLILEGGTHNPLAPPFDFVDRAFLPLIRRMGPQVKMILDRPGFYPAGGGKLRVFIEPVAFLRRLDLLERGSLRSRHARALVSALPAHIATRELEVIRRELSLDRRCLDVFDVPNPRGPGNVVLIEVASEHITEVFTGFGRPGVRAEKVAQEVVQEARRYLTATVPVGEYLADQLLLPLALGEGGAFSTFPLSPHAETNIGILKQFLNLRVGVQDTGEGVRRVDVARE